MLLLRGGASGPAALGNRAEYTGTAVSPPPSSIPQRGTNFLPAHAPSATGDAAGGSPSVRTGTQERAVLKARPGAQGIAVLVRVVSVAHSAASQLLTACSWLGFLTGKESRAKLIIAENRDQAALLNDPGYFFILFYFFNYSEITKFTI